MSTDKVIQLAHGGGGRLTRELIESEIVPRFGSGPLRGLPDGATLPSPGERLVFTTDSFVVQPLEFPGGNIGDLAVHGTVNDLAVCGGEPKWLSLALIIEEGLTFACARTHSGFGSRGGGRVRRGRGDGRHQGGGARPR